MATKLIATPQCDSVHFAAPGEESTWTQNFVWMSDATNPLPSVWNCMADEKIPKQGQRYTKDFTIAAQPAVTSTDARYNYVCRSVDVAPVPQSPSSYTVRVVWSTRVPQSSARPWFKLTRSTSFRTAAAYRSGSTLFSGVPADGTVAFPPTSWASGTKVDSNGTPLQFKIAQQSIQVDILWDRTKDKSTDAMAGAAISPDPPSEWTSVYCNTRNAQAFLGWPVGYVTYLGWTANEQPDEWLVISHRFLADDWQHLEQRPGPNAAGKPLLAAGPTWGTSPALPTQSVANVAWFQPYQTLSTFENLFSWRTNLWAALNTPEPAR